MKKSVVIVLVILLLIVLAVAGYFVKVNFDERSEHINEYRILSCWVECPLVPDVDFKREVVDPDCMESCIPEGWSFNEKYVLSEWLECNDVWAEMQSYTELQICWSDALPNIKAKYPYVAKD